MSKFDHIKTRFKRHAYSINVANLLRIAQVIRQSDYFTELRKFTVFELHTLTPTAIRMKFGPKARQLSH